MAKQHKSKPKLTANQAAFDKEVKRLERYVSKYEKLGFVFPEDIVPKRPERVTKKRLTEIQKTKSRSLLSRGYVPPTEKFNEDALNKPVIRSVSTPTETNASKPSGGMFTKVKYGDIETLVANKTKEVIPDEDKYMSVDDFVAMQEEQEVQDILKEVKTELSTDVKDILKADKEADKEEKKQEKKRKKDIKNEKNEYGDIIVVPTEAYLSSELQYSTEDEDIYGWIKNLTITSENEAMRIINQFIAIHYNMHAPRVSLKLMEYVTALIGLKLDSFNMVAIAASLQKIEPEIDNFIIYGSDIDMIEFNAAYLKHLEDLFEDHAVDKQYMTDGAEILDATGRWGQY